MALVERRLSEREGDDLSAAFVCALAVAWPRGPVVVAEGRIEGELRFPPRGALGFGYDPIFAPQGSELTFGEMAPEAKDAISHRARAFAQIKAALL
jgi:XTP/dITP diphosphohydrolase